MKNNDTTINSREFLQLEPVPVEDAELLPVSGGQLPPWGTVTPKCTQSTIFCPTSYGYTCE